MVLRVQRDKWGVNFYKTRVVVASVATFVRLWSRSDQLQYSQQRGHLDSRYSGSTRGGSAASSREGEGSKPRNHPLVHVLHDDLYVGKAGSLRKQMIN